MNHTARLFSPIMAVTRGGFLCRPVRGGSADVTPSTMKTHVKKVCSVLRNAPKVAYRHTRFVVCGVYRFVKWVDRISHVNQKKPRTVPSAFYDLTWVGLFVVLGIGYLAS